MEKQTLIQKYLHTRVSNNLHSEILLLDAIEKYEVGAFEIVTKHKQQFEDLIAQIKSCRDRNAIAEETIGKDFGTDNFELQMQIKQLAYYVIGKQTISERGTIDVDILDEWSDTMEHGFYASLTLTDQDVERLLGEMRSSTIMRESRSCSQSENLAQYCRSELSNELTDEDIIAKIDHMNDGAYTYLPEYLQTLAFILLRDDRKALWYRLLKLLKYFPLQGALLYDLHTVKDCLDVIRMVSADNTVRQKVLLFLLRERLFNIMREEHLNLLSNVEDSVLAETYRSMASEELKSWDANVDDCSKEALNIFLSAFGMSDMLSWLAAKDEHSERKSKKYRDEEEVILKRFESNVFCHLDFQELDLSKFDLTTLLYVSNPLSTSDRQDVIADNYLSDLCCKLYSDKGLILPSLSEKTINRMRQIYNIMLHSKMDLLSYPQKFKPQKVEDTQDYYQQFYRCQAGDAYWYSVMMLMREKDQSAEEFWKVAEMLLSFNKEEHQVPYDCYFHPLYLAEIIATQILPEVKDKFESALIETSSRISIVLRILTANGGNMVTENKRALLARVGKDWESEASHIKQQDNRLYKCLEEYISKIKR